MVPGKRTIDELASAAGVLVSTVRLYQNRGLLPPPERRGRLAHYGDRHLDRLRLIAELQNRGFSLASIKELVDGMERGQTLASVLGLDAGDAATWTAEAPEILTLSELAARLPGVTFDGDLVRRAVELGVMELAADGTHVVLRHPSLVEVGSRLAALGVPADATLDQYELLRADTRAIADRFTDLFRSHLWEPSIARSVRAGRISDLVGVLEELGPLAEAIVVACLRLALQEGAERFAAGEAARLGIDVPRPGAG